MTQVIMLGTGAAYSDPSREQTYLVVKGRRNAVLVDCGGSPTQRLARAGVALNSIDHIVLTHHHPDHLYGLPVFLLDLWLAKRKRVLHIYGLRETLRAAKRMMQAFEWERWFEYGFFPIEFHAIPNKPRTLVFHTDEFSVFASPTKHSLPAIAVCVVSQASGKAMVYSSDTVMCAAVAELASGADLLIHEATMLSRASHGHSSAVQAGMVAHQAGVKKLVLTHLPPGADAKKYHAAAKKNFKGQVIVSRDFARYEF